jgi:hypothetical protein
MRSTEVDIHKKVKDICRKLEGCVEDSDGDFEIKTDGDEKIYYIQYFDGSEYSDHFQIKGWNFYEFSELSFDFFTPDDTVTEEELLFLELRHEYNVKFVNHDTFVRLLEAFRDGKHELLT